MSNKALNMGWGGVGWGSMKERLMKNQSVAGEGSASLFHHVIGPASWMKGDTGWRADRYF